MKFLIWGAKGWLGNQTINILNQMGEEVLEATSRADNEKEVEKELLEINPDRVISLIGRTYGLGFNTIDYLEQKGKLVENLKDNLYGPFVLAMLCTKHNIHLSSMGTGCIFNSDVGDYGEGYTEEDKPDFFGSSYSTVRGCCDKMMHFFEKDVLNVRIRMPCSDTPGPRNFITKIMTYEKVCSIPNSITCLPTLLPIMIDMSKNKVTGTINLTNPGVVSHNEILELVKEIINPDFTWKNFTLEEQSKILSAGRSNNMLNTDKLISMYPNVPCAKDDIKNLLYEMKKKMGN